MCNPETRFRDTLPGMKREGQFLHGIFPHSTVPINVRPVRADGTITGIGGQLHGHDFTEIVLFTQGTGGHVVNGTEHSVSRGDVFVIEHVDRHFITKPKDLHFLEVMFFQNYLHLPYELLSQTPGFAYLFLPPGHVDDTVSYRRFTHLDRQQSQEAENLIEDMRREHWNQAVGHEAMLIAGLIRLMVFLSRCYPLSVPDGGSRSAFFEIQPLLRAIQGDMNRDWTAGDLASIGNMSESKLFGLFKEATGDTPISYLIRLRIRAAMVELRNSRASVTEIAYRVGFSDSNYFARQFRKVTGMSPSEYRRHPMH